MSGEPNDLELRSGGARAPVPHAEHRAAGELLFELADEVTGIAQRTHRAIARRAFGLTGTSRTPIRLLHDAIADASYGAVRAGSRAASVVAGTGIDLAMSRRAGTVPLSETQAGGIALAALNGWSGDVLERRASPLRVRMAWRRKGEPLEASRDALAAAYPGATGKLAIFVHGLMESEDVFWLGTVLPDGGRRPNYGERLERELGYSSLYLRYNTGLHVSENGRRLASLIERTVAAWPVEVTEITIYGHSMGGLVARSANHYAREGSLGYVHLVRHVIHSGSPNHGSGLERFANGGAALLNALPESSAFGDMVNSRSAGVKDMRYGNVVDEDWEGHDPDELWTDRRVQVPLLETASHYFLAASLTGDPQDPVSRVLGDLLVVLPSAWAENMHGKGTLRRFEIERSRSYGGLTHFHLTSHPAIYEQLVEWLRPAELSPGTPSGAESSQHN